MTSDMQHPAPQGDLAALPHPLPVLAFEAANARSYLHAVFEAYAAGHVVMVVPQGRQAEAIAGVTLTEQKRFAPDPGWFATKQPLIYDDRPAQLSFSSGTTGTPKAILLSHTALSDVVSRINAALGVTEEIREYVGVPVTFSFGFGRVRAVAAVGGQAYLPPNGFEPTELRDMLAADQINAISAVPTLWRVLLSHADLIGDLGKRVRWIEIGSQYMARAEKEALKELFPEARIVQHYGLTEASRSTLLDISQTSGPALESVGAPTGQGRMAISETGLIQVAGPHVAMGLITENGLHPLTDEAGWLTTSDRGHIVDGRLYYDGRLDEVINCGGTKIDPAAFEQALAEALNEPTALAVGRVPDTLRGEKVLVVRQADATDLPQETVESAALDVAARFGLQGRAGLAFRTVSAIPRTATGKIQRAKLADLPNLGPPASQSASDTAPASDQVADQTAPSQDAQRLQAIWAEVLGVPQVGLDETFYDLGGDSLSALSVVLRAEKMGFDPEIARQIFDGKTIREIAGVTDEEAPSAAPKPILEPVSDPEAAPQAGKRLRLSDAVNAINATRGVLAWWVVLAHWMPGLLLRLSDNAIWIFGALTPVVRFGTPGFAMVFGMGLGALRLAQFRDNPDQVRRSVRVGMALIFGGVLVMALFEFGVLWARGRLGHPLTPSILFYSAISYYALAMLFLPWMLRIMLLGQQRLITLFFALAACLVLDILLSVYLAPAPTIGWAELGKILLTAKYGFFRMTAFVMVGVIIGYLYRRYHDQPGLARVLVAWGAILIALGGIVLYEADPSDISRDFGKVRPWHLSIYAGCALLLLAGFSSLSWSGGTKRRSAPVRWILAFCVASGMMALPIFVGHAIVIPANNFLEVMGAPFLVAELAPPAVFFAALAIGYRKFMRLLV